MYDYQKLLANIDGVEYCECHHPACTRIVKGALYCCANCAEADAGNYEIHTHSFGCGARQQDYRLILGISK